MTDSEPATPMSPVLSPTSNTVRMVARCPAAQLESKLAAIKKMLVAKGVDPETALTISQESPNESDMHIVKIQFEKPAPQFPSSSVNQSAAQVPTAAAGTTRHEESAESQSAAAAAADTKAVESAKPESAIPEPHSAAAGGAKTPPVDGSVKSEDNAESRSSSTAADTAVDISKPESDNAEAAASSSATVATPAQSAKPEDTAEAAAATVATPAETTSADSDRTVPVAPLDEPAAQSESTTTQAAETATATPRPETVTDSAQMDSENNGSDDNPVQAADGIGQPVIEVTSSSPHVDAEADSIATSMPTKNIAAVSERDSATSTVDDDHSKADAPTDIDHSKADAPTDDDHSKADAPTDDDHSKADAPTNDDHSKTDAPTDDDHSKADAPTDDDHSKADAPTNDDHSKADAPTDDDHSKADAPTDDDQSKADAPIDNLITADSKVVGASVAPVDHLAAGTIDDNTAAKTIQAVARGRQGRARAKGVKAGTVEPFAKPAHNPPQKAKTTKTTYGIADPKTDVPDSASASANTAGSGAVCDDTPKKTIPGKKLVPSGKSAASTSSPTMTNKTKQTPAQRARPVKTSVAGVGSPKRSSSNATPPRSTVTASVKGKSKSPTKMPSPATARARGEQDNTSRDPKGNVKVASGRGWDIPIAKSPTPEKQPDRLTKEQLQARGASPERRQSEPWNFPSAGGVQKDAAHSLLHELGLDEAEIERCLLQRPPTAATTVLDQRHNDKIVSQSRMQLDSTATSLPMIGQDGIQSNANSTPAARSEEPCNGDKSKSTSAAAHRIMSYLPKLKVPEKPAPRRLIPYSPPPIKSVMKPLDPAERRPWRDGGRSETFEREAKLAARSPSPPLSPPPPVKVKKAKNQKGQRRLHNAQRNSTKGTEGHGESGARRYSTHTTLQEIFQSPTKYKVHRGASGSGGDVGIDDTLAFADHWLKSHVDTLEGGGGRDNGQDVSFKAIDGLTNLWGAAVETIVQRANALCEGDVTFASPLERQSEGSGESSGESRGMSKTNNAKTTPEDQDDHATTHRERCQDAHADTNDFESHTRSVMSHHTATLVATRKQNEAMAASIDGLSSMLQSSLTGELDRLHRERKGHGKKAKEPWRQDVHVKAPAAHDTHFDSPKKSSFSRDATLSTTRPHNLTSEQGEGLTSRSSISSLSAATSSPSKSPERQMQHLASLYRVWPQ